MLSAGLYQEAGKIPVDLVHAFTLGMIKPSIISVFIFAVVTYVLAYILHIGMRKVKNDRFNSSYTNKK